MVATTATTTSGTKSSACSPLYGGWSRAGVGGRSAGGLVATAGGEEERQNRHHQPPRPPRFDGDITQNEIESLTRRIQDEYRSTVQSIVDQHMGGALGGGDDNKKKNENETDGGGGGDGTRTSRRPPLWKQLSEALGVASEMSAHVTLPSMTHGDAAARAASTKAKDVLKSDLFDATFANLDLYQALRSEKEEEERSSSPSRQKEDEGRAATRSGGGAGEGGGGVSCPNSAAAAAAAAAADARARSYLLLQFERVGGCHLPPDVREMLLAKRRLIESLCSEFVTNINEDTTTLVFTEEELDGLGQTVLDQYPIVDGAEGDEENEDKGKCDVGGGGGCLQHQQHCKRKRKVTLKAPDTMPILQFATNPDTRRRVSLTVANKCRESNTPLFLRTLALRQECAELLGYPHHAGYMLRTKMAGSSENATEFLHDLHRRLQTQCRRDLAALVELKRQEEGCDGGGGNDGAGGIGGGDTAKSAITLQPWDVQYYSRKYKATLGVDEAALRTYFPLEHVKNEILAIYQELLVLEFVRVDDDGREDQKKEDSSRSSPCWHEDVECYAVYEATTTCDDGSGSGDGDRTNGGRGADGPRGYFFLDLFPREGKYAHQCVYPLRPSYSRCTTQGEGAREGEDDDGGISQLEITPACANIGNLSRGTPNQPIPLLRFREVETFFHEFGHVMHCVLSQSRHSVHAWAWSAVPWPGGVEQDFLEVPSMMLENFVWQPEILRRLSNRPEDCASLPDEMIDALSKSRHVLQGYGKSRYLAMSMYDLLVHGGAGPDYAYSSTGSINDGDDDGSRTTYDAISLYHAMLSELSGVSTLPDTFPVSNWYHPMMGYDAGYYGYVWSEAYAADLFHEFEKKAAAAADEAVVSPGSHDDDAAGEQSLSSVIQPDLGSRYRDEILAPCGTRDGMTMLERFLGRPPALDAFLERLEGEGHD